jgi:hypothetical protein
MVEQRESNSPKSIEGKDAEASAAEKDQVRNIARQKSQQTNFMRFCPSLSSAAAELSVSGKYPCK